MTVRRAPKRLRDVRDACAELQTFTEGKTFDDYVNDRGLRLIVERLFEIVGEAMNQAIVDEPALEDAIPESHQAIGMRNRLIHGYDAVSDRVVWDSVHDDIPALRDRVTGVLDERGWS